MSAQLRKLEHQVNDLSPEDRERLALRLLAGLRSEALTEIDEAWIREAERRYKAWKKGQSRAIGGAAVLRELRKGLR